MSSLADAVEHRDKISDMLQEVMEDIHRQKQHNDKKDDREIRKAMEGINNMRSE